MERQYQHMFASEPGPKRPSHRALCKSILKSSFCHWNAGPLRRRRWRRRLCSPLALLPCAPPNVLNDRVAARMQLRHCIVRFPSGVVGRDALRAAREAAEAIMTSQNSASDAGLGELWLRVYPGAAHQCHSLVHILVGRDSHHSKQLTGGGLRESRVESNA